MPRRLFLTSSGLGPTVSYAFLTLFGEDPTGQLAAFIPTAADPERSQWFVGMARRELQGLGFEVYDVDLKAHTPESLWKALAPAKLIYVNGGNTFYLLHWARKSGLLDMLPALLDEGKMYVGTSAGSILVGPSIEPAAWEPVSDLNTVQVADLTGARLVHFAPFVHYNAQHHPVIHAAWQEFTHPVIVLADGQAVLVLDGKHELVGAGPEQVWERPVDDQGDFS